MIDDKIVLQFLEFVAEKTEGRKDYSVLFEQIPDFHVYLRYLKEEGLIAHDGSFSSGNQRKHVTSINSNNDFHHFEQYANIQLTSKGFNYLKEKRMTTLEKIKAEFGKEGVSWFVKSTLSLVSYVMGALSMWLFQKIWW